MFRRPHEDVDEAVVPHRDEMTQKRFEGLGPARLGERLQESARPAIDIGGLAVAAEAHRAEDPPEGGSDGTSVERLLGDSGQVIEEELELRPQLGGVATDSACGLEMTQRESGRAFFLSSRWLPMRFTPRVGWRGA